MAIRIKGKVKNRKVFLSIKLNTYGFRNGIRWGLFAIGRENVKHARKLIKDKNKTGRIYNFRGRKHRASAPGEAPANMTGALQKTMKYEVRGSTQMEFGDREFYGKFLEDGTKKMRPRPHLSRTVREKARDNKRVLAERVEREMKRYANARRR